MLAALAVYLLGVRFIERRTPDELALNGFARELAAGLLLGAAVFTAVMGVLVAAGAYTLTGPTAAPPWRSLAIALSSGVVEELVFRGVLFRLLWCAFGIGWGLAGLGRPVRGRCTWQIHRTTSWRRSPLRSRPG